MTRQEICAKKLQRIKEESERLQKSFQVSMSLMQKDFNRAAIEYNDSVLSQSNYYSDISVIEGEMTSELLEALKAFNFNDSIELELMYSLSDEFNMITIIDQDTIIINDIKLKGIK